MLTREQIKARLLAAIEDQDNDAKQLALLMTGVDFLVDIRDALVQIAEHLAPTVTVINNVAPEVTDAVS